MGFLDMFTKLPDVMQGGIMSAASSAVDFGFQALGNAVLPMSKAQRQQNDYAAEEAQKARDFSAQQAEISRDWQEEMYAKNNSLQGKINQAKAAGVNPMFAVTGSATSPMSPQSPTVAAPSAAPGSASPIPQISDMIGGALGFSKLNAEIRHLEAQTRRENGQAFLHEIDAKYRGEYNEASIHELWSLAQLHGANADYFVQAAQEKISNISKIEAETENIEERTRLVTKEIEKMSHEIANIDADTSVKQKLYYKVGAEIRNLDGDTEYKAQLCSVAMEQALNLAKERYIMDDKQEHIKTSIAWLEQDLERLKKVTSREEAEKELLKLKQDTERWNTKVTKRAYKFMPVDKVVGYTTDVVNAAGNIIAAAYGMPNFGAAGSVSGINPPPQNEIGLGGQHGF